MGVVRLYGSGRQDRVNGVRMALRFVGSDNVMCVASYGSGEAVSRGGGTCRKMRQKANAVAARGDELAEIPVMASAAL